LPLLEWTEQEKVWTAVLDRARKKSLTTSSLISGSLFFGLPSAMAAGALVLEMLLIAMRRPALAIIFFFIFFAFAWRLGSTLYIDLFGPVFSEQLNRVIGPGTSAVPLAISQSALILAILFSFRRERLQRLFVQNGLRPGSSVPATWFNLFDLSFWVVSLFVIALWAELLLKGPIPLFAGIERFEYSTQFGGPLHRAFLRWGPMLAFQLGVLLAAPAFSGRALDWRFGALFAALMLYLFLVGHRFSSFYNNVSFFIIPIGVVLLQRHVNDNPGREIVSKKVLRSFLLAGTVLVVLIVAAVTYSYTVVRGFEGVELLTKVSQRILVQQGEMWWMTYEHAFVQGDWNGLHAATKLFVSPFNPNRNSTMQFLMERALPLDRAHDILRYGSSYTGGWPEVFFELGGPAGGLVFVCIAAIVFSEFMYLLARCIVQERFVASFFLTPLLYTLSIMIVSGMINSFIQVTFLIKIAMALVAYLAENAWRSDSGIVRRR
jgi:Family of unknown function (DUF6418)